MDYTKCTIEIGVNIPRRDYHNVDWRIEYEYIYHTTNTIQQFTSIKIFFL